MHFPPPPPPPPLSHPCFTASPRRYRRRQMATTAQMGRNPMQDMLEGLVGASVGPRGPGPGYGAAHAAGAGTWRDAGGAHWDDDYEG